MRLAQSSPRRSVAGGERRGRKGGSALEGGGSEQGEKLAKYGGKDGASSGSPDLSNVQGGTSPRRTLLLSMTCDRRAHQHTSSPSLSLGRMLSGREMQCMVQQMWRAHPLACEPARVLRRWHTLRSLSRLREGEREYPSAHSESV
jgi:hypothetical protein